MEKMACMQVPMLFLILSYLLVLMCDYGNGAREITKHEQQSIIMQAVDDQRTSTQKSNIHTNSFHRTHLQAKEAGFLALSDLQVGKIMPMKFPSNNPSLLSYFLPKEEADMIPFSLKELPNILSLFSISPGTDQANSIEDTLRLCEVRPLKRESKICAISLESMLDFIHSIFGLETPFKALTTTYQLPTATSRHNYTILHVPKEVMAPNLIACHLMIYPYAVFYCHTQEYGNKVFEVSLGAENGDRVEAVAVCHMDTSDWANESVFHQLGLETRGSPICHIFSPNNIVWVPISK